VPRNIRLPTRTTEAKHFDVDQTACRLAWTLTGEAGGTEVAKQDEPKVEVNLVKKMPRAAAAAAPAAVPHEPIGWPEAVARLAGERTRAVACASRARALDAATAQQLGTAYAEAKAEIDAVIAGLSVALAEGKAPVALPALEKRLAAGLAAREAFCRAVMQHLPAPAAGTRGWLKDVLDVAAKPLIEAIGALYKRIADADKLCRDTIRAQLESTRWPEFDEVKPAAGGG
jgi:hypothetical protein